jgi:hypothetical protein
MPRRKLERVATIGRTKDTLDVLVPADMQAAEVGVLFKSIVDQIERLTGHPCLSGTHDVILRNRFEDVARVTFG